MRFTDLEKKYPQFLTDVQCGADCGRGWVPILDNLMGTLDVLQRKEGFTITVAQIKEKFGGLRFYIGAVPTEHYETVYTFIDEAEQLAYVTCEDCGEPGKTRQGGWIRTLCDECENRLQQRKKTADGLCESERDINAIIKKLMDEEKEDPMLYKSLIELKKKIKEIYEVHSMVGG